MEEINIYELFEFIKGKLLIVTIFLITLLIFANIFTFATRIPLYKSTTTVVLVNESKNNVNEILVNQKLVGTYSEIIKSRKVLNDAIERSKIKIKVEELIKHIEVSKVNDTEIIKISISNKDKKTAAKITDEVANAFIDEIKDRYKLENVSVLDKAEIAKVPYNTNYFKDNLIYLIAGLFLSGTILFMIFYFDTSVKTSEEIEEKLGLTVYGIIPLDRGGK